MQNNQWEIVGGTISRQKVSHIVLKELDVPG